VTGPRGIWHFSFTVSDLDQAVAFYRDVLGMEVVHAQDQDNDYTRSLVGYADASLRVAQLRAGDAPGTESSHDLELVQYVTPAREPTDPERARPGAAHMAFVVDDADAEHERLAALGVRFLSAPNAITAGVNKGGKCCYFLGPDEVTLELVQPPPR
jgi:lactoylglutathione lyase